MTTQKLTAPTTIAPRLPLLAAVGIGGSWIAFALGETVIGELDALDSAAELAANSGRVVTAGLLHVLAGVLLTYGLVGLADRVRESVFVRVSALLVGLLAPCLGAFGMLHLLALELDDSTLQKTQGFGAWGVPVLVVALLGAFLLVLLLASLARLGVVPWWAVGVTFAGAALHLFGGSGLTEVGSHWLIATGMLAGALTLARR